MKLPPLPESELSLCHAIPFEAGPGKVDRAKRKAAAGLPFDLAGTPIKVSDHIHQKTGSCHNHNRACSAVIDQEARLGSQTSNWQEVPGQ